MVDIIQEVEYQLRRAFIPITRVGSSVIHYAARNEVATVNLSPISIASPVSALCGAFLRGPLSVDDCERVATCETCEAMSGDRQRWSLSPTVILYGAAFLRDEMGMDHEQSLRVAGRMLEYLAWRDLRASLSRAWAHGEPPSWWSGEPREEIAEKIEEWPLDRVGFLGATDES